MVAVKRSASLVSQAVLLWAHRLELGVHAITNVPGAYCCSFDAGYTLLRCGLRLLVDTIAACRSTKVHARLPPSLNPNPEHTGAYEPMPSGWLYGTWHVTFSSQPNYLPLLNLQWNPSPHFPENGTLPGQNNDLSSFQLAGDTTIHTAYGIDTPRRSNDPTLGPGWADIYDFVGTGGLRTINNSIEMIAWGYDTDGVPYAVMYETPVLDPSNLGPADIDIDSRSDTGPTNATLGVIFDELLKLGNKEIAALTEQIVPLVQNGARRGLGPVVCDAACVNNGLQ